MKNRFCRSAIGLLITIAFAGCDKDSFIIKDDMILHPGEIVFTGLDAELLIEDVSLLLFDSKGIFKEMTTHYKCLPVKEYRLRPPMDCQDGNLYLILINGKDIYGVDPSESKSGDMSYEDMCLIRLSDKIPDTRPPMLGGGRYDSQKLNMIQVTPVTQVTVSIKPWIKTEVKTLF